jgi:colanic acid biosynthesis glycosyl transferase WcaI
MRCRVSNYLSYLALAMPRALTIPSDLVLAMTDPPVAGIAGALVARLTGRPFVYNIRDLYPEMAIGGEIVSASGWVTGWKKIHSWALRQATRVIVLGNDMRERILAEGIAPERVAIVRDGATLRNELTPESDSVIQEIRCGFPFVVLHAGNLGFYGAWETLVKAAEILRNEDMGFVFVGDGANHGRIKEMTKGLTNVRFLPFRPAEEIPNVMAAGDLHVVTVRRGLEGVIVPSKLYSTLAAGRPILAIAPEQCDAARIVRDAGCGLAADPDDPRAVADAIRALRQNHEQLAEMGRRARERAKNYGRAAELNRFLEVIEEAAHVGLRAGEAPGSVATVERRARAN